MNQKNLNQAFGYTGVPANGESPVEHAVGPAHTLGQAQRTGLPSRPGATTAIRRAIPPSQEKKWGVGSPVAFFAAVDSRPRLITGISCGM